MTGHSWLRASTQPTQNNAYTYDWRFCLVRRGRAEALSVV